ncbi:MULTISPECIES: hypothetical protein [Bacillus cereus group]|uniref:hypothetical protein n=1 Tax=Bacillus cereus group TaxID=86661 RepID=UPI001F58A76F|nr:hypothetical protein [Bacillus cereus group sp. BfR-BA-01522]
MTSLVRSYIFRFLIGFLILLMFSPLPSLLLTQEGSYFKSLFNIFYHFIHFSSISIPMIDWMHESILFSPQLIINSGAPLHASEHSTPLFPYVWKMYFFSLTRFIFTLVIGFSISFAMGHIFLRIPKSMKKYASLLYWIPYSFSAVILQCTVILFSLYIAKHIIIPSFSSIVIILSAAMIIVMQAIKKWIPFLSHAETHEIHTHSFLINTLFTTLISNHKSLFSSIIVSFCFMECIFHTNGLLQFMIQFGGASPTIVAICLLLLYIPYIILSFLQSVWRTKDSKHATSPVTRTMLK